MTSSTRMVYPDLCSCRYALNRLLAYTSHGCLWPINLYYKAKAAFMHRPFNNIPLKLFNAALYLNWNAKFFTKCPHLGKASLVVGASSPHINTHPSRFQS